ncbi:transcription antitermination factor NusB [Corynebacterium tuscaniense]|uniref:Transcription antitermination protein NusB n=1 Tax=Corynebacterium tuscaniense TaxID=302449 RepID=A0A2N6T5W5_9CORY|nr:transcription antitermination factor NusB [Corynebacterium tuscaniense]KAA8745006.1 transcription antitermination factor NusB [Corynebacterium tuscaniense]PMC64702.1 transcription antitermination factor NusB [Corynebacterium tuscaniense]
MSDYKRHGARYRARRRAVDILFEAETRDVDPVAIVEDRIALAEDPANAVAPVAEYTREIISGAAESLDEIDEAIARFLSEDWELNRLPAVDRAILRVAAWEILYNPDVAPSIVISNAMEMSVEYAGDTASPYIHAVLDDIIQAHSAEAPDIITGETGLIGFTEEDAEAASTEEAIDSEASAELEPGFDTDQEAAQEQE